MSEVESVYIFSKQLCISIEISKDAWKLWLQAHKACVRKPSKLRICGSQGFKI